MHYSMLTCQILKARKFLHSYNLTILIVFFIIILNSGCKPEPGKPEEEYILYIKGKSNIGKTIEDGTTAYFVEQGRTDTLFKTMRNEEAAIKIHAEEGERIQGTAGKENKGHEAVNAAVTVNKDLDLPLVMPGKDHDIHVEYTLTTQGQTATLEWGSEEENESVTYDINVNGNGHQDVGPKTINVGTTPVTENRVLTANDWTGDAQYHVTDQDDGTDIAGALVTTSQNKSGTTNSSGIVTLIGYIIDENLIHTIIRSREQPIASNGTRTDTLTTTIGALDNGLNYDLLLQTSMYNDESFRTHVNGGKEWNYSESGDRTMNINGITRSLDLSQGTYADDLTPEEMQAIRDRMELFDQDFWNRATGLVILDVNHTETPNYNTSAGSINIFYDRTEPQPGNTHYQISTTRDDTYDHGIGFVSQGIPFFLGQFSAEVLHAADWVSDYNGGSGDLVGHDENGNNPYFAREDDLVVNMTYVGGKAPKNE